MHSLNRFARRSRSAAPAASVALVALAALLILATTASAGDDTARFYGTWKTVVPANGQMVTVVSVHDASGVKNYIQTPAGLAPAGEGTYSAANGKWSSNAPYPNNGGVYHFLNDNTVVAVNAAGQATTWVRDKAAEAAAKAGPPSGYAPKPGPLDANTAANRSTGYVPPSGRPGASVTPPAAQPAQPAAAAPPSASAAENADDAKMSPNVKAGFAALKRGDRVTAWRDFMSDAQKGDADAEAAVGSMLFQRTNPPGTGFYAQCEKWLLSSANQGNEHGMDMLAQYYYNDGKNMAGGIRPGRKQRAPVAAGTASVRREIRAGAPMV